MACRKPSTKTSQVDWSRLPIVMFSTSLEWRSIPNPHVAVTEEWAIFGANALLFFPNEAPNFVAFHVAHLDVPYFFGHDALTLFTSLH